MNQPHIIRIRGPWQCSVLEAETPKSDGLASSDTEATTPLAPHRVEMPSNWVDDLGADFRGSVRYERHFNKPTGLTPSTRICIVFDQIEGYAKVQLNGEDLGDIGWPIERHSFDVAGKLESRNLLRVDIQAITESDRTKLLAENKPVPAGGLVGEVRLEIG